MRTEEESPAHWEPGSPAVVVVPRLLGLSGGGAHHAVARAFVGPRSRVTYVMLRPSYPSAAAFRWPPTEAADGVLHSEACGRPSYTGEQCGCPLELGVDVVDLDTYLAPGVLPVWLRPFLASRVQRRALRVCPCLLHRMDTFGPDVEIGMRLHTLLGIPILGPRLHAALRTQRASELATMPYHIEDA